MAKRKTYTPEEKERAIAIYVESGRKEAELQTGIKGKTIAAWVSRAELATVTSENRQKGLDEAKTARELQQERIYNKMRNKMESLLDDFDSEYRFVHVSKNGEVTEVNIKPQPADKAKLATAFGILFDKNQLATGGPTANTVTHAPDLTALVAQNKRNEIVKNEVAAQVLGATE